jgi:two-component system chemotaxis response regulator CheV
MTKDNTNYEDDDLDINLNNQQNNAVDDDEDELELIRLISNSADIAGQFVVFEDGEGRLFAMNVAKVEELMVYKELDIAKNTTNSLIEGVSNIRENMTSIVKFDRWFGNKIEDDNHYELVMLCEYGGKRIGLVIKRVETIINIPSEQLKDNSDKNEKTTFITEIIISGKKRLCMIFDSDLLLKDVFSEESENMTEDISKSKSNKLIDKTILFADDSKMVRKLISSIFDTLGYKYQLFDNGQLLIDKLNSLSDENRLDEVGLIVTDVEMPVLDGFNLIRKVTNHTQFSDIPIIAHTNMATPSIIKDLTQLGAAGVVNKINLESLQSNVEKYSK